MSALAGGWLPGTEDADPWSAPVGTVLPRGAGATAPVGPAVELGPAECRLLLETATVGRISFTDGALPAIVPVPFVLHGGEVLIPAQRTSRLVDAVRGSVVAFGVDSFDPRTETGWSVTVVGPSRVIGDPARLEILTGTGLSGRWTAPERHLITVQVGLLSGWRVREPDQERAYHTPLPSAP